MFNMIISFERRLLGQVVINQMSVHGSVRLYRCPTLCLPNPDGFVSFRKVDLLTLNNTGPLMTYIWTTARWAVTDMEHVWKKESALAMIITKGKDVSFLFNL